MPKRLTLLQKADIARLREKHDYTYREIASELGMPMTTVQSALRRHRQELLEDDTEQVFESIKDKSCRCPIHGKINVVPCVACAAEGHRTPTLVIDDDLKIIQLWLFDLRELDD